MIVREVMTPRPLTAPAGTSVGDIIEMLVSRDIRHLPIVEHGELIGVVSDRDVRQFSRDTLFGDGVAADRLRMPITKFMSADVISVDPEDDVDDVIDVLIENKVGAVPVVDGDGDLVGIVSYIDVLKHARGKL